MSSTDVMLEFHSAAHRDEDLIHAKLLQVTMTRLVWPRFKTKTRTQIASDATIRYIVSAAAQYALSSLDAPIIHQLVATAVTQAKRWQGYLVLRQSRGCWVEEGDQRLYASERQNVRHSRPYDHVYLDSETPAATFTDHLLTTILSISLSVSSHHAFLFYSLR